MRGLSLLLGCLLGAFGLGETRAQTLAITGGVADGGDCASLGSWNPASNYCAVASIDLGAGDSLVVDGAILDSGPLRVAPGAAVDLVNGAQIWVAGLSNHGTITGETGAGFDIYGLSAPAGLADNFGTIQFAGDGYLNAPLRNHPGAVFEATGFTVIYGTLALENAGSMSFFQLESEADVLNQAGGSLTFVSFANFHGGTLTNHGRIDNLATSFGGSVWSFANHATFNNLNRAGSCDEWGSVNPFVNHGTFNNSGTFWVCTDLDNFGTLNHTGTFLNGSYGGRTIVNAGEFYDCGSVAPAVSGNAPIAGTDADLDGRCGGADCAPADETLWSAPSPARFLRIERDGTDLDTAHLDWTAPLLPGGTTPRYDVIAAIGPNSFDVGEFCVEADESADRTATDTAAIGGGQVRYYLVRSENSCGDALAPGSSGTARAAMACP